MTVEWRRSELPAPPVDDAGEPELIERLRREIGDAGPITFARFMERALYEPGLGYYATSADRPTRAGDFLTAPELHPIFGHVLARRVDTMWQAIGRPETFTVREFGAGRGTLFLTLLEGLSILGSDLLSAIRYQPIDLVLQRDALRERLAAAGHANMLSDADVDMDAGSALVGVVVANEFLDALPVHRVVRERDVLQELYVDWQDGRFVERVGELSDFRLKAWFSASGIELLDGQRAEASLAMLDWVKALGLQLQRGFAILIDYGGSATDLYAAHRMTGTLRAFRAQHVSSDVLSAVGHQDITAHVDFDALQRAARGADLMVVERRRQAEFLIENGLDDAYAAARTRSDRDWGDALNLRSAVRRLIDPQALGGYQVAVLGKGL